MLRPNIRVPGTRTEACSVPAQLQIPSGAVAPIASARPRALCWAPTLVLLGYLAASLPWLKHTALAVAVVVVAAMTLLGGIRWWRARGAEEAGPETSGR
jgi:hypothetical protein